MPEASSITGPGEDGEEGEELRQWEHYGFSRSTITS
jgi:hypothetical protein